ncbi:MAG: ATP-binding protein [Oscillospiraceae bacterium]|nr:ATP-binding protein [Oscillospiraceae bacterium]
MTPAAATNLFAYSRHLPVPFDKLTDKKVKVASKYSPGSTEATLSCSMLKAIHALCDTMRGTSEGALGQTDHLSIAEYKSSMNADAYHLVVYNRDTGNLMASVYDKNTETNEVYTLNSKNRDGAAVLFAVLPKLLKDPEFSEHFDNYRLMREKGYPVLDDAKKEAAYLCDNAYRRVTDDKCPAHVKLTLDKGGNLTRISSTQMDSGAYTPTNVISGQFTIFTNSAPVIIKGAGVVVEHKDFVGKYTLNTARTLNPLERMLVPTLPDWYIIPKEAEDICKHACQTTGKSMPMRNFLLRGPAGTGKTMGAQAIAAGLGLPYVKYTCSAGTEIYDFIGQIFPETDSMTTGDEQLDKELETLNAMGGITYENVSKVMNLPELDDMDYDPEGVYQSLTGQEKEGASSQDCMAVVLNRVTEKVTQLSKRAEPVEEKNGQNYTYVETDFIKALKNGYVVEIQEPTTIMQPGVLVGLNSLLEQTGSITLPTGEIIQRHPDAVVVITTNVTYEGCRGLNQSVIDRMSLVRDVELPSMEVMVQRAMSVTGCEDENMVSQMVQVTNDMAEYMHKNQITDGICGMRSLIDWIISTEITGDPYTSALYTIISKATADPMDREAIISTVLEPFFAPKRKAS